MLERGAYLRVECVSVWQVVYVCGTQVQLTQVMTCGWRGDRMFFTVSETNQRETRKIISIQLCCRL